MIPIYPRVSFDIDAIFGTEFCTVFRLWVTIIYLENGGNFCSQQSENRSKVFLGHQSFCDSPLGYRYPQNIFACDRVGHIGLLL